MAVGFYTLVNSQHQKLTKARTAVRFFGFYKEVILRNSRVLLLVPISVGRYIIAAAPNGLPVKRSQWQGFTKRSTSYIGSTPHPVTVANEGLQGFPTKNVIILVVTVTGWGVDLNHTFSCKGVDFSNKWMGKLMGPQDLCVQSDDESHGTNGIFTR